MIYVRVVRSNATEPEDIEYMVQISEDGIKWVQASHWLNSGTEAEDRALSILSEYEKQTLRQNVTVVSTFSGDTQ